MEPWVRLEFKLVLQHETTNVNSIVITVWNHSELEDFFRELNRHQLRLRGLVRCLLFNAADVEDVWQDTNLVLLKKAEQFQPGT